MKRMTVKVRFLALLPLVATIASAVLDCPPGWDEFDDSCYKVMTSFVYSQSLSWDNARAVCLGYGGDLVSIENAREMEFIRLRYAEYISYSMWIGLNDRIKQREFVWSDGTPFNGSVYSNWRDGEPNDWSGQEDCVELYNNGWNDLACSRNHYYMCERPKGKLSCPDGWFPNGFSCYKASESEKSWNNAKQDCYESGSYLMKVDDASEQHFLEVYLRSTGIVQLFNQVWIGLSDIEHEGRFTWEVDNSTVNFSNWEPGQPNNGGNGRQHCVTVGAKEYFGLWNDDYCPYPYLYICEKPLDGISCYQCESSTSFAKCSTKQETVNCAFPRNYCFKQKNTTGGNIDQETVFSKDCTSADQCRKKGNHSLECCEDDLCNTDISCYQCSSNISFADCAKNQKRVNCTLPKNRCVKTTYGTKEDNKTVTYHKGCATIDECTEFAKGPFAECCTGDMCNKGKL
ncbi:macrophage mannose receptor 1-like isoform X2 [Orbicella faveolata]|uniref:macrophage mannose receptor 1-like isoform X2 n=1 Tax=Orbicella faveolata TaxID=48498 RepID=UPI0009E3C501|nr:macrophage mannose receptor 1-like isoform X2 [Orbicella faveolata]